MTSNQQNIQQAMENLHVTPVAMPTTITSLIGRIDNPHQRDTLEKISPYNTRHEEDQIFMSRFIPNQDTTQTSSRVSSSRAILAGTFEILGCMKKGVRTRYEVKLYQPNTNIKGSFWCNCSDFKFHSSKYNKVCKHVCFIVCKLGKILDPNYFSTKQLTPHQFESLYAKATDTNTLRDCEICIVPDEITLDLFKKSSKPFIEEDSCPICFDDLASIETCIACPSCHNHIHRECMHVWLEQRNTCVYCRSTIWEKYKKANRTQ